MSTVITRIAPLTRPGRRERSAARRRLRQLDTLSARLAELRAIDALLEQAVQVVDQGWVQGGWFAVATSGGERLVTAYDLSLAANPVTGACLVGAVVQAGGGPAAARTQLVQRTLDLMWHTLRESPERPVRWCPGPRVRTMALLEMTRWNDDPRRTRGEVRALLRSAQRTTGVQRELCLAERSALSGPSASAALG